MIRFKHDTYLDPCRCSVDPITATALAIGAVGGGIASSSMGSSPTPATPAAPPPMAPPAEAPQGQARQNRTQSQTFLGAAATPPTQSGSKTLLGQ